MQFQFLFKSTKQKKSQPFLFGLSTAASKSGKPIKLQKACTINGARMLPALLAESSITCLYAKTKMRNTFQTQLCKLIETLNHQ